MTDIKILSCPQCGFPKIRDCGNGLYQCDDCGTHFDKNENIVQTNEEWLRSATTEQLADKLTDFSFWLVPNYPTEDKLEQIRKNIVEWLKEKHDV